jgi:general secretion pathway protein N
LGAPWNTLQPSGQLVILVDRLHWLSGEGPTPPKVDTALRVQALNIASRVSTLPVLGSYEMVLAGEPHFSMALSTLPGSALELVGQGRWASTGKVGFRGQARAAEGREEALSNLLNIIGRREGARSLIAVGSPEAVATPTAPKN